MNYYFILTNNCNYHCDFCIRSNVSATLKGNMDYITFCKVAEKIHCAHTEATITLTGGEPTLHPDFKSIVDKSSQTFKRVCLTSNGSFDKEIALFLKKYMRKNLFVQISLDGTKEYHNKNRGTNAFEKAVFNIDLFSDVWTHVAISTTIGRNGLEEAKKLALHLNNLHFHHWKVSQEQVAKPTKETIIPTEEWNHFVDSLLPLCHYRIMIKKMFAFDIWQNYMNNCEDIDSLNPSRNCVIGKGKVYITPQFDVLPCTCMNETCGNLLVESLEEINERLEQIGMINPDKSSKCFKCKYKKICNGGCPGYSMKVFNKLNMGDIRCPLL